MALERQVVVHYTVSVFLPLSSCYYVQILYLFYSEKVNEKNSQVSQITHVRANFGDRTKKESRVLIDSGLDLCVWPSADRKKRKFCRFGARRLGGRSGRANTVFLQVNAALLRDHTVNYRSSTCSNDVNKKHWRNTRRLVQRCGGIQLFIFLFLSVDRLKRSLSIYLFFAAKLNYGY